MSAYFTSVIVVSVAISLALAFSYREGGGAERTALMLLLLYVCAVPIVGAVRDFDVSELEFETVCDPQSESALADVTLDAFENGVKMFISEEYSIDVGDISVSAEGFDPSKMCAEHITVILSGEGKYADFRDMRERIKKNGLGECEVKIEI